MVNLPEVFRTRAKLLVCAALALWMIVYWGQTAVYMEHQYTGYPLADYWVAAIKLPSYQKLDFSVLWEQHNEHRVIVPELTFAVDDLLFGAHELFPLALNVLFQILTFGICAWVIWSDRRLSSYLRFAAIAIGGIVLGWPGISYVLSYPFVLQWTIVQFMLAAALLLLVRNHVALPTLCAVVATFSAGHGMLLWPVLLLFGLILEIGWRRLAAFAVTAAASILLYFHNLVPSDDSKAQRFLHEPSWFAGFLTSMLSMPFGADRRLFGLWLGSLSFLLFAVVFFIAWRRRLLKEDPAVILFGLCIFSLLTVLLCGIGRTLPEYWDYPTAKVARYLNVPICYWASLLLATYWVFARVMPRAAAAWAAVCLSACGMAYQFPKLTPWVDRQLDMYSRLQSATIAIESGVPCDSIIAGDVYPEPSVVHKWDPLLRQQRLSIYSDGRFRWIGKPLSGLVAIQSGKPVEGGVTTTVPFACATQLAGWMDERARNIVLVNERGVVAGLGRRLPAGLPLYLPKVWAKAIPRETWTGFVNYIVPSQTVQPYVVSEDGRSAAKLGVPVPVAPPGK